MKRGTHLHVYSSLQRGNLDPSEVPLKKGKWHHCTFQTQQLLLSRNEKCLDDDYVDSFVSKDKTSADVAVACSTLMKESEKALLQSTQEEYDEIVAESQIILEQCSREGTSDKKSSETLLHGYDDFFQVKRHVEPQSTICENTNLQRHSDSSRDSNSTSC